LKNVRHCAPQIENDAFLVYQPLRNLLPTDCRPTQ
jgi:hypothetical protein